MNTKPTYMIFLGSPRNRWIMVLDWKNSRIFQSTNRSDYGQSRWALASSAAEHYERTYKHVSAIPTHTDANWYRCSRCSMRRFARENNIPLPEDLP